MAHAKTLFDPTADDPEDYVSRSTFEEEAAMIAEAESEIAAGKIVSTDQFKQMLAAMRGEAPWPETAE